MQSFQTAKNFLYALMYAGWAFVALCVIAGFVAMNETNVIFELIGGGVVGFLIIAVAQMGLAQITTAENTGQILEIMRAHSNSKLPDVRTSSVSKEINKSSGLLEKQVGTIVKTFRGYEITKASTGCTVDGFEFPHVLAAEKWISENPKG